MMRTKSFMAQADLEKAIQIVAQEQGRSESDIIRRGLRKGLSLISDDAALILNAATNRRKAKK